MPSRSITLKEVYDSLQQLRTVVEGIADDLDERAELSEEALAALRAARETPEEEYIVLE